MARFGRIRQGYSRLRSRVRSFKFRRPRFKFRLPKRRRKTRKPRQKSWFSKKFLFMPRWCWLILLMPLLYLFVPAVKTWVNGWLPKK